MCIHLEYRDMLSVLSKAPWAQYKRTAIFFHNATLNSADVDFWSWSKINFQWSFAFDLCRIRIFACDFINLSFLKAFAFFFFSFPSALAIIFLIRDYQKSLQPEENMYLCIKPVQ